MIIQIQGDEPNVIKTMCLEAESVAESALLAKIEAILKAYSETAEEIRSIL